MNSYSWSVICIFAFLCIMACLAFSFKKKKNDKLYWFFVSLVVGSITSLDFSNVYSMILNIINPNALTNPNFLDIYSFIKGIIVTILMYFASPNVHENNRNTKPKDK